MIVLPGRNFARYMLMIYILFCMIIRVAYQAKQFEFLQKEMRPADVETIEEMIAENFTFYSYEMLRREVEGMDFIRR